jgi:hypothetical protein
MPMRRVLRPSRRGIGDLGSRTLVSLVCLSALRLLDSAQHYENEEAVGKAARECGVPREELFISA